MSEASDVMVAFGGFRVGDHVLLRCEPSHAGYHGVIESFFDPMMPMTHVRVLCDVGGSKPVALAAEINELELL